MRHSIIMFTVHFFWWINFNWPFNLHRIRRFYRLKLQCLFECEFLRTLLTFRLEFRILTESSNITCWVSESLQFDRRALYLEEICWQHDVLSQQTAAAWVKRRGKVKTMIKREREQFSFIIFLEFLRNICTNCEYEYLSSGGVSGLWWDEQSQWLLE